MGIESPKNNIDTITDEKISNEEFEKQFAEQTVTIDENEIRFILIKPHEIISEQFVVIIGGIGSKGEGYKKEMKNLAKSGRKVLFMNPLKGIQPSEQDREILDGFDVPEVVEHKTTEALMLLEHAGIDRADFIGHSQGAIISSMIAVSRPGIADNLVLTNPAGMHGEESSTGLVGRTAAGVMAQQTTNIKRGIEDMSEGRRRLKATAAQIKGTAVFEEPKWRLSTEIPGIAQSNIIPALKNLKDQQGKLEEDKKTKITLLTANEDNTFSPKQIEENIGIGDIEDANATEKVFAEVIDSYAMYIQKDAKHDAPMFEKHGLLTQIVNEKYQQGV